jgi:hypothetical protein
MMEHIIVCPFDEKLLARFKKRKIVINTIDFSLIQNIFMEVRKYNELLAIKIQTDKSLSDISFREEWFNIPLAVYSPEFGNYKDLIQQLILLKKLNIRIFLSCKNESNYTGLRILSSLNISCGLFFDGEPANWDLLNDLMHYDIYSRIKHAPIEPFAWLASNYAPSEYTDFNSAYFNNPARYLHINEKGQIALTETDLTNNNFIDEGIDSLENIYRNKKYKDFLDSRYEIMLLMNECSFCEAFRICLSKFPDQVNKKDTCKKFFSDFIEAADFYYSKKTKEENQVWRL